MAQEAGHHRRSIRIRGADYTEAGAYFLTMCADRRRSIFGRIEDGLVQLTPLGEAVEGCWFDIPKHFVNADLKEFVVMPNHLHGIVVLAGQRRVAGSVVGARYIVPSDRKARTPEAFQRPVVASIPTIVRTFKAAVTRAASKELRWTETIWQRNYYEHVLRDGDEYLHARQYILENPMMWETDCENPEARVEPSGAKTSTIK